MTQEFKELAPGDEFVYLDKKYVKTSTSFVGTLQYNAISGKERTLFNPDVKVEYSGCLTNCNTCKNKLIPAGYGYSRNCSDCHHKSLEDRILKSNLRYRHTKM